MNGVTIGQAAAFVGVTVKTVRHYHKLGLVKEPERDGSGYRRYGSAELLRLVKARTLAAAGVPLAETGPLLDADAALFTTVLADVERQLTERIEELIARGDFRFVALTKQAIEATAWEPDDPRLAELATAIADHFLASPAHLKIVTGLQARTDAAARYHLIAHHGEQQGSATARGVTIVEAKLRAAGVHIPRSDTH